MIIIFISLLSALPSHAARFEGEPIPVRKPCDEARVAACQREHAAAGESLRAPLARVAHELAVVGEDLSTRKAHLESVAAALLNQAAELRSARAELRFLDDNEQKNPVTTEIFPGAPTLESVFSVDRFASDWDSQFAPERRKNLKARESEMTISGQKFAAQKGEIERDIAALAAAEAAFQAHKNELVNNTNLHARMCENGCRQQVCPTN